MQKKEKRREKEGKERRWCRKCWSRSLFCRAGYLRLDSPLVCFGAMVSSLLSQYHVQKTATAGALNRSTPSGLSVVPDVDYESQTFVVPVGRTSLLYMLLAKISVCIFCIFLYYFFLLFPSFSGKGSRSRWCARFYLAALDTAKIR